MRRPAQNGISAKFGLDPVWLLDTPEFGHGGGLDRITDSHLGLFQEFLSAKAGGDHVNVAQRLERLPGKPITQVFLLERGTGRERRSKNFIAPITLGRTVFMRVLEALQPIGLESLNIEETYRSSFSLKRKGSAIEAYELFPEEIIGDRVIRILEEFAGTRISNIVKKSWKAQERKSRVRGFMFDEELADKLAARYFPS